MKIYDKPIFFIGILVFVTIFTLPIWIIRFGTVPSQPKIELPKDMKECIASTKDMKSSHMQFLNDWRDSVVREGNRIWISHTSKQYNMSLTNECLRCHNEKSKFCDQCHNYVGVNPFCWDCHTYPKEVN